MLLILQILFTILSALCIGAFVPVGVFLGWGWAVCCALLALAFFALMLLCKQSLQLKKKDFDEKNENP